MGARKPLQQLQPGRLRENEGGDRRRRRLPRRRPRGDRQLLRRRRRRGQMSRALRYAPALLALVAGLAAGRASAPSGPSHVDQAVERPAPDSQLQAPADFARTPLGAADAVAAYQRSFATTSILGPGALRKRIEAVAMPAYVEKMIAANAPGEQRIATGAIGQGLQRGLQTLYAAVPIGYRVEAFSSQRARVLTWGFTLLGNAASIEPAAYFGLTRTKLAWFRGGWRIAETRGGFGPTPKLATQPGPLGSYDVMNVAPRLRSYSLAP